MPNTDKILAEAFAAHQAGRLDEAAAGYQQVLDEEPNQADALHLLGVVEKNRGATEHAEKLIKRAILLRPGFAAAHYNLANLYADNGRVDEAIANFKQAIAYQPIYPEAYYGLGNMLRLREEYGAAAASFELALQQKPDYLEARHNRANVLRELRRVEESVAELKKVLTLNSQHAEAHYNLALSLFMQGRYEEGAPHYAWRFQARGFSSPDRKLPQPLWDGKPAPSKTLLVYAEQGLGDTLQFMRYVHAARPRVGQLIFEVQPQLVRLLTTILGDLAFVVPQGRALPPYDLRIPLMNLIGLLDSDIPQPYLKAMPDRVEKWRDRLAGKPGLKVGINWQGNPDAKIDRGRSIPLLKYAPLFAVPGARFISLQKNAGSEQLQGLPASMPIEVLGDDFDVGPDAFLDAAGVMMNLDLFITTDTALAHLAGGLGCPTWLLLKRVPDWRWGLDGEVTHWYKKTKIYRQEEAGNWDSPIRAMVRNLESWQSGAT